MKGSSVRGEGAPPRREAYASEATADASAASTASADPPWDAAGPVAADRGERPQDLRGVRCLIASLRHSPGLAKEFGFFAERLSRHGAKVRLLLAREYEGFPFFEALDVSFRGPSRRAGNIAAEVLRPSARKDLRSLVARTSPHFVLLYNPHPANGVLLRAAKRLRPPAITALFLHEPFKPRKRVYGFRGSIEHASVEALHAAMLRRIDVVLVPSVVAEQRFQARFPEAAVEVRRCSLLIPDVGTVRTDATRDTFTLVGQVNPATGLDTFLGIVLESERRGLPYRFRLVTPSNVLSRLRRLPRRPSNLRLQTGRPLTDGEIDEALQTSRAVFRCDREITQSGVVPVAFRNGTPVIAPDLPGFAQDIRDGFNGRLFPVGAPFEPVVECMEWVLAHPEARANARQTFLESFSPAAWSRTYDWLVDRLAGFAARIDEDPYARRGGDGAHGLPD